jgi:hypothetical protein
MNKNRFKILFLSVIILLLSCSSLLLPIFSSRASAATDPGQLTATKYLYVPFTYSRTKPVMKDASGCDTTLVLGATKYAGCKDVASGIGVYNYVGNHTPERANISSVVLIDQQTKDVLYPSWALVSGGMRIYGLEKGHTYTGYFIYDDKASSDIKKLEGQVSKYCLLGGQTTLVKGEEAAFAIAHALVNGCSRYSSEPFLPAALNPFNLNGGEAFKYSKDITNLKPANITAPDPAANQDQQGDTQEADPCKVPEDTNMRWLACAAIEWGEAATNKLDATIQNFLFTPPEQIFTDQMHTAWSTFRTVGVILILIAGLAMVISQAAGMDIFDAYTVKKVLPRLVIAAIGITLSWPILKFIIVLFNDLGVWAHDIIMYPFQDLANNAGASIVTAGTLAVTGFLGYLILFLGPLGTAALLGTIALGLLIGLLVLALRQMVILIAVLMAPLAIAAYILPGTQKLWEFWKSAFLTALYMFPIIMGFIAAGKAMAGVAASVDDSPEMHLLSVLLYFAPYFLLPFAFKLAGGLMATVFSIANDRSRGLFDRSRKKRQEIMAERRGRAASNSLWDPRHKLANTAASWVASPGSNAVYGLGKRGVPGFKRGSAKIAGQIEHARVEQSGKLFEELNKAGYNDKAYRAIAGLHSGLKDPEVVSQLRQAGLYGRAPATLGEIENMGRILSSSTDAAERLAGNAILGSRGRLSTLYQDPEMMKASIGAAGVMGLSAHGFASGADLAEAGNMLSHGKVEEAGFAQSILSQAQLLGMRSRPDVKPGYGVVYKNGKFVDGMSDEGGRMSAVLDTFSAADLASAKGGAIKRVRPEIERRLRGERGATPEEAARFQKAQEDQLFSWAGPYSQASADVKAQALDIIDTLSGGRKMQTREYRTADGKVRTEQFMGYDSGTIGEHFERYTRADIGDPSRRGGGPSPDDEQGNQGGGGPR